MLRDKITGKRPPVRPSVLLGIRLLESPLECGIEPPGFIKHELIT